MRSLIKLTYAVQIMALFCIITASPVSAHDETSSAVIDSTQVFEGVLLDRESFLAGKTGTTTVEDLKKKSTAATVFGLALQQKDGSVTFFSFDANGQTQTPDVLKNYPSGEHVKVTVVGEIAGDLIKVVTVTEKLDEKQFTGILVDKKDFEAAKDDPAAVTRESLQTTEKIASGYGVAIRQPHGGYSFFKLDDNSQISAAEIIAATKKERGITVVATGTWNGTLLQAISVVENSE
jgi:hypothetical protein